MPLPAGTRAPREPRAIGAEDLALCRRTSPFSADGWTFELKYDGFRLLATKTNATVQLMYRSGRIATDRFPDVAETVRRLPAAAAVLDGELVVFDAEGRSDFDLLRSRAMSTRPGPPARACIFDLLALEGRDLRPAPAEERKELLRELLAGQRDLVFVDQVEREGERAFDGARRLGLEGIVAKPKGAPYRAGYRAGWLKMKVEETSDFVVMGIAAPSRDTFDRPGLLLGLPTPSGGLRYVGRVAVGAKDLVALDRVPQATRTLCTGAPPDRCWLAAPIVCEVRHLASSRRGLRAAVFLRYRPDKRWEDC